MGLALLLLLRSLLGGAALGLLLLDARLLGGIDLRLVVLPVHDAERGACEHDDREQRDDDALAALLALRRRGGLRGGLVATLLGCGARGDARGVEVVGLRREHRRGRRHHRGRRSHHRRRGGHHRGRRGAYRGGFERVGDAVAVRIEMGRPGRSSHARQLGAAFGAETGAFLVLGSADRAEHASSPTSSGGTSCVRHARCPCARLP